MIKNRLCRGPEQRERERVYRECLQEDRMTAACDYAVGYPSPEDFSLTSLMMSFQLMLVLSWWIKGSMKEKATWKIPRR